MFFSFNFLSLITLTSKWAFFSQSLRVTSSAFFIGLVTNHLDTQQISLWYLALAIGGSSTIIEGGLSGVLTRNLTYVENADSFNRKAFTFYIKKFGFVFTALLALYLTIFFSLCYAYMGDGFELVFVLMVFGGFSSMLMNNFLTSFLIASGHIWKVHRSAVFQSLAVIILCVPLISRYGISGVAFTFLTSNLVNLFCSFSSILNLKTLIKSDRGEFSISRSTIAFETIKSLPGIASFHLLTNVSLVFFSPLLGVDEFASYAITLQCFNIILSFLNAYYMPTVRQFTVLVARDKGFEGILLFRKISWRMSVMFLLFSTLGYASLTIMLHFFQTEVKLVGGISLYLLVVILMVEFYCGCMSQLLLAFKIFVGNYLIFLTSVIYAVCLWLMIEANLLELLMVRLFVFVGFYLTPIMYFYLRLLISNR